ncbi:hypothetical protein cyc_02475 [Cyclospora cayetanensis]|uniref:Uncharacterized protein n=1 Tax=Cyclospora cayetanensis TaxID=88456 RepID=A0A1D3D3X6_9EIME|nr:hypothetical protein cyc_02475 [Cyclospora cayetanensis]
MKKGATIDGRKNRQDSRNFIKHQPPEPALLKQAASNSADGSVANAGDVEARGGELPAVKMRANRLCQGKRYKAHQDGQAHECFVSRFKMHLPSCYPDEVARLPTCEVLSEKNPSVVALLIQRKSYPTYKCVILDMPCVAQRNVRMRPQLRAGGIRVPRIAWKIHLLVCSLTDILAVSQGRAYVYTFCPFIVRAKLQQQVTRAFYNSIDGGRMAADRGDVLFFSRNVNERL